MFQPVLRYDLELNPLDVLLQCQDETRTSFQKMEKAKLQMKNKIKFKKPILWNILKIKPKPSNFANVYQLRKSG